MIVCHSAVQCWDFQEHEAATFESGWTKDQELSEAAISGPGQPIRRLGAVTSSLADRWYVSCRSGLGLEAIGVGRALSSV